MVARALLLLVGLGGGPAQGRDALSTIQTMVARPPVLCGAFDQRKSLVGVQRPVRSSGRFCVLTERGVLWSTLRPFPSTLRLTREEIVESSGERVTSRLATRDEPTVGIISELLFSVLAGDFNRLRRDFTIDATVEAPSWRAHLVPKDGGMRRVIASIDLQGSDYVRDIVITDASGDRTTIGFAGIAAGDGAMLPEERRAFAPLPGRTPPAP